MSALNPKIESSQEVTTTVGMMTYSHDSDGYANVTEGDCHCQKSNGKVIESSE